MARIGTPDALLQCSSGLATTVARMLDAHRLYATDHPSRRPGSPDLYVCEGCHTTIRQEWRHGGLREYQMRHQAETVARWLAARDGRVLSFHRVPDEDQSQVVDGTQLPLPIPTG